MTRSWWPLGSAAGWPPGLQQQHWPAPATGGCLRPWPRALARGPRARSYCWGTTARHLCCCWPYAHDQGGRAAWRWVRAARRRAAPRGPQRGQRAAEPRRWGAAGVGKQVPGQEQERVRACCCAVCVSHRLRQEQAGKCLRTFMRAATSHYPHTLCAWPQAPSAQPPGLPLDAPSTPTPLACSRPRASSCQSCWLPVPVPWPRGTGERGRSPALRLTSHLGSCCRRLRPRCHRQSSQPRRSALQGRDGGQGNARWRGAGSLQMAAGHRSKPNVCIGTVTTGFIHSA